MIKYLFVTITLITTFLSCKNDFETPASIAIVGIINNQNIEVIISKALPALGRYNVKDNESNFFVNNATVELIENDVIILDLKNLNNGKYYFNDGIWRAKVNNIYKIVATIPNYGKMESEYVVFPDSAKVISFKYDIKYDITTSNPNKLPVAFITAQILVPTNDKVHHYQMEYNAEHKDGRKLYNLFNLNEYNTNITEKKAAECGMIPSTTNGIYFTSECFSNGKIFDLVRMDGTPAVNGNNTLPVEKMNIRFNSTSESFHKFVLNRYIQEGTDLRFQEMPPSYTNIKNGVGVFYAKNTSVKAFNVHL